MKTKKFELVCINSGYIFCNNNRYCHCKNCSKERYAQDLILWRMEFKKAEEHKNYPVMDDLNRRFEYIGLP